MSGAARPSSKNVSGQTASVEGLLRRAALVTLCLLCWGLGAAWFSAWSFPPPDFRTIRNENSWRESVPAEGRGRQGQSEAQHDTATPGEKVRSREGGPSADRGEPQRLSSKSRQEIFEKVWREIRDHYYDPAYNGVNWNEIHEEYSPLVAATKTDNEFYALMSQMTSELHDAHTRFNSPEQWKNYKRQQRVSAGFSVDDVDGKTVVTSVRPDSSAAHAGIEPGMVVVRVDGRAIEERIAEIEKSRPPSSSERATRMFIYGRVFGGPPDSVIKVGLQRANGSEFEAAVTRQIYSVAPDLMTDVLPSGHGYIRFDGFQPRITKEFKQALERFRNSPGIVIDLRRNGGGDLSVLLPIAGYFFGKRTLFAKDSTRSGKPLSEFAGIFKLPLELYVGKEGEQIYSGPVVILVDARSASSSEVFAAGMQDSQRARIVGTQSCGCVLGIARPREMKGGGVLEMSEVLWFSPKGRKLEGTGVIPDRTVNLTLTDLQKKRDPALVAAAKELALLAASNARPN
jgi:carboxyl-terminal processing protease